MKKKFADEPGWFRIYEKSYVQMYVEEASFTGYVSLLTLKKVEEPICVNYGGGDLCIVDNDYEWLMLFPIHRKFAVTASIDNHGNIVQWYIDLIKDMGLTEAGVPYIEDLYLDIVYLPDGCVYVLDADELEDALEKGTVSEEDYITAKETAAQLVKNLQNENNLMMAETLRFLGLVKHATS
ncbi:DUF402 domain-containing protein [Paenibacillus allorhizosphaerae]|uniref:DUF402 domain-containing protein n=1 Tax=Paenibacillus allorhizosphaerae TaxID=2849866 RepID=A0ABM8VG89_9BACL|nr:DUF402 domain-containing protein [Paenibacillus allorhizosphaerae]CAG7637377.1 hypothetical protein PAECIP111802_02351 [Paenibacillus allorhizosphaerae]